MKVLAGAVALTGLGLGLTLAVMASFEQPAQTYRSFDGTELCYFDQGQGRPVILLHGLMVDSKTNFGATPYKNAGRRVIMLDARGHGCSAKPYAPAAYADRAMARDVLALIAHLDLPSVDVLGYSMGGYTAIEAAGIDDGAIGALILGGIGSAQGDEAWFRERAAEMLEDETSNEGFYRQFADETGADRFAIGAWFQGAVLPQIGQTDDLSAIHAKVFIVNGTEDENPAVLGARFGQASTAQFDGDHISVLQNPRYVSEIEHILRLTSEMTE